MIIMIIAKIRITADTDAIIIIVVVLVFNDIIPLLSLALCCCWITIVSIISRKVVTENPLAKIFHLRASETNSITLSITWISICDSAVSLRGLNSWRGRDFWHSSSFCKLCKMRPDKFIGLCEFQQCQWKKWPTYFTVSAQVNVYVIWVRVSVQGGAPGNAWDGWKCFGSAVT